MERELPATLTASEAPAVGRPVLVVVGGDAAQSYPLPDAATWVVGRAPECDVHVDDAQISRQHCRLYVGAALEVEDLGSANGTKVRGALVPAGTRAVVAPGDVIDLGAALLVLQRQRPTAARRRLWSHGELELRLEEECARQSERRRSSFALLRVRLSGELSRAALEEVLTADLRADDVVALYAPREYALLYLDTLRSKAERLARNLQARVEKAGGRAEVGVATHPEDGVTADALVGAATRGLRGGRAGAPAGVIVEDDAMRDVYRVVDRVAPGKISVLLTGETGVGKEVVADALHARSPRRGRPFVRFNCAALSESLVEAELFGHEKGAFTGADQAKAGLLESADGGTVLLDEVAELPLSTQAKLLRVLEQREVLRVGSLKPRPIDVRVVSATHEDLARKVEEGRFRRDLLYRLDGVTVFVPPLRERTAEIEPLARLFLAQASEALGRDTPELSADALALLESYGWPGNIRELRNVIERAVLMADELIEPAHLPLEKLTTTWTAAASAPARGGGTPRDRVMEALERASNNQTRAAELLGVSRQTLSKWLDRYNLPRPRKR